MIVSETVKEVSVPSFVVGGPRGLRQDPLDLSFWSFLTFLHHGIEKVERHLV